MNLSQLQSLVALAELGSLSEVGRELHLSAAAIQKQLKSLSQEFEVEIYRRVRQRLELSEEARLLIPYARAMLATHSAATAMLRQSKSQLRGTLRVGAGPAVSTRLLPELIGRFMLKHPNLELLLETGSNSTLVSQLSSGKIEIVLSCGLQDDRNLLSFETSWETELVVVVRTASYPRCDKVGNVGHLPMILFPPDGNLDDLIFPAMYKCGVKPLNVIRVADSETIRSLVLQGAGLGVLPYWTVSAELAAGVLKLVSAEQAPLISKLTMVTLKDALRSPGVQSFIEMARNHRWLHPCLVRTPDRKLQPRAVLKASANL